MTDPDWEERVRAEARIHADVQAGQQLKGYAVGCGTLAYLFSCIFFPPLLLAIPVWLIIMFVRAKPRKKI